MTPALTAYLARHAGVHLPAKETPIESPLQFLLEMEYQRQREAIRIKLSAGQVRDAASQ